MSDSQTPLRSWWMNACCDAVAVALIAAALIVALRTTRDLRGAHDPDHFRDIAQAQTTRDGHPLSDPYYRGEWAWYNPLLAWTLAAGSAALGVTVEQFHVHDGPWLNLLGPIAFYLLAVRVAGRRAAIGALALYLFFVTGNEHSWASATYSPWPFSGNFAEGLFFAAGLALLWADANLTAVRAIVAGACIGLTFLAHTAPGLILALAASLLWWRRWRRLPLAGAAALVCALPFLGPLALHYGFHVAHATPLTYQYDPISAGHFVQTLEQYWWLIAGALAGAIIARPRFVIAWLGVALALTLYAMVPARTFLPAFHFWLYVTAALALLTGTALAWVCRNTLVLAVVTIVLVAWNWHAYESRADLATGRFLSLQRIDDHIAAATRLRALTTSDDVVLGGNGVVRLIIGPAARKTVAPDPFFANPYVAYEPRNAARDRMLAAIERGDMATFAPLARANDVSTTVVNGASSCEMATRMFPLTWRLQGDICISVFEDAERVRARGSH